MTAVMNNMLIILIVVVCIIVHISQYSDQCAESIVMGLQYAILIAAAPVKGAKDWCENCKGCKNSNTEWHDHQCKRQKKVYNKCRSVYNRVNVT